MEPTKQKAKHNLATPKLHAAFAAHRARLARQVKRQVHAVKVGKDLVGHVADGALGDLQSGS